jgi:hypothetical protein
LARSIITPDCLVSTLKIFKTRIYDNIIPHFFLVTAGVAVKLVIDFIKTQQRLTEMAKEKAENRIEFPEITDQPAFSF